LESEAGKRFADAMATTTSQKNVFITGVSCLILERELDGTLKSPLTYVESDRFNLIYGDAFECRDLIKAHNVGETTLNGKRIPCFKGAPDARFINKDCMKRMLQWKQLPLVWYLKAKTEVS
jgi:hypothetical protein